MANANLSIAQSGLVAAGGQMLPPKGGMTIHQKALLVLWLSALGLKLAKMLMNIFHIVMEKSPAQEQKNLYVDEEIQLNGLPTVVKIQSENPKSKYATLPGNISVKESKEPSLEDFLTDVSLFGFIMFYYHLCDYEHYFPAGQRSYSRDLFAFLMLVLMVVSALSVKRETTDKLLNRDQTEEWKGWMQVMFVWYHYFHAKETYNAIRVFIGAYVWMTGFGNFSFFWVRKDFSLYRVLKMLFRLNFLVVLTCLVTNNEYMLYYICAMHTFWFLSVYAMMKPLAALNEDSRVMMVKFVLYTLIVYLLFDVPGLGEVVFSPFKFVLGFRNSLHEWMFRAGLDHYSTLIGMLCAFYHPNFEKLLYFLDHGHNSRRDRFITHIIRFGIALFLIFVFVIWFKYIFVLPKYEYNKLHPYFSFIPLLTYIYLRNMFPFLRERHSFLLSWLGKITLETYISQLHVYLQGNATLLIMYIPGYPLLNFALSSFIYVFLSYHLFQLTVHLSAFIIPKDSQKMFKRIVTGLVWILLSYLTAFSISLF